MTIGTPRVQITGNVARLEADVFSKQFEKVFFFEVKSEYGKYLCYERSDAFVLGLLYFALVNGYDIECTVPMSERLYYQLTYVYIPTVVKNDPALFNPIKIIAPLDNKRIENEGAVGASVSGGVDSFYSILRNYNNETTNYNITHLVIANCSNIYYGEDETRKMFNALCGNGRNIAKDLGLPIVEIYTNEHIFWYKHYMDLFCLRYASFPYALQKLFAVYNYSTGYQYKDFTFTAANKDASHYDFFSVHLISNENLTLYSSGGEVSRAEKAEFIADNRVVQKRIQVCNVSNNIGNCGQCEKCLRTQLNFYACGKLDNFTEAFDVKNFYLQKDKAILNILSRRGDYDREILSMMKTRGIHISSKIRFIGNIHYFFYSAKQKLKKIELIYKIYHNIKKKRAKGLNEIINTIESYNSDIEFARKCDSDIILF